MTAAQEGQTRAPKVERASDLFGTVDAGYANGTECVWHGPMRDAVVVYVDADQSVGSFRCPTCFGVLRARTAESFWAEAAGASRGIRDLEAMLRWSAGKCFPDYTTLEEAWHQAITE